MTTITEATPRKRGAKTTCTHYWLIEPHAGPTSRGFCRHCGAENEFRNYLPYSSWDDDPLQPPKPGGVPDIDLN
jgi:hypothetical protein